MYTEEEEAPEKVDDPTMPTAEVDVDPFRAIYNLDLAPPEDGRIIFFSRHGESEYNVQDRIGGNPDLTERGETFARAIGKHVNGLGNTETMKKTRYFWGCKQIIFFRSQPFPTSTFGRVL